MFVNGGGETCSEPLIGDIMKITSLLLPQTISVRLAHGYCNSYQGLNFGFNDVDKINAV